MYCVRKQETKAVEVEPGLYGAKLVDGSDGARRVALLSGWLKPGAAHSPHMHESEEAVTFLSGRGVVRIGGQDFEVGPGDAVWIPPGAVHSTLNTGEEDLRFVAAFSDGLIAAIPAADGDAGRKPPLRWLQRCRWFLRRVANKLLR